MEKTALKIETSVGRNKLSYDTEILEVSLTLPSGRVLWFSDMYIDEYAPKEETNKDIEEYKKKIVSMLEELGVKVEI